MKVGDIVKFKAGLYPDEENVLYRVIEMNGDRVIVQFICDLPIPPQSIARTDELEIVGQQLNGKRNQESG